MDGGNSARDYYIVHRGAGGVAGTSREARREAKATCEKDLESALEQRYPLIVIEPRWLGDEAIRWITFGNFLHKTAVLASFGCLATLPFTPPHLTRYTCLPLGLVGFSCAVFYDLSWQFDPCCQYQVDYRGEELTHIPSHELNSRSPVVLVRRNDVYRKILHTTLALAVAAYFSWRFYRQY